ncbi:hypothetical protein [Sinorhizobium meliloti]|uniref:hypothetical protein n=1 Tax=Rhizobium meliloti TaxID=382 RepID=UPI000FDA81C7|nr:hypothetical protein [Sinorhizobium meliloti]RVL37967.1 hypothetical protein CN148_11635 [Sinorhizobium meliloti]
MIHEDILNRYDGMLAEITSKVECCDVPGTDACHLRWMLANIKSGFAGEKSHRWLGFVQGVMIARGITTVQAERDFTRPYFSHY